MNETAVKIHENRFLSFNLGTQEFAIPLLGVREVMGVAETTQIPYAPSYFAGVMNLRGQIISVVDLRKKLNIKPNESPDTAIIICDLEGSSLGIVVDSVNSVLSPAPSDISPRPEIENKKTEFITGVYRKNSSLVLLLDVSKALNGEDRATMTRSAAA